MKPLYIEFCPQADSARSSSGVWLLLLGSLVVLAAGVVIGISFSNKVESRQSQARELLDANASLNEAARQQERVPADMVDAVNAAIRMLDYPSIELLTQLERHARPDVLVVAVEMGPVRTTLRVVVQAAAAPQVLDYMDSLKTEPDFQRVALTRQEASSGDAQGGWRFTLEVPQAEAVQRASARMPRVQE